MAAFTSCDRGSRWPGGVCPLKAGVISGEQPKGRPVEPSPSVRDHADETIMDEARDGHRHRSPFRLRKRQPKILDRERRRHARGVIALVGDLAAICFVHLAVEQ